MNRRFHAPWHLAVTALLACCATAPAPPIAKAPPTGLPWPHELSDLPTDPRLDFSRLDNGLRLVVAEHRQPPGRCSLRLVVHVGSREEADGESGMAHFVEHMAFNGTRRFPSTSIVEWFQRQGMAFGRDLNAFTSFASTIYVIDLARCDGEALTEGLEVLLDFATGIRFEPAAVEGERSVIDAEERERSSPEQLAQTELRRRLESGTRSALRPPIGRAEERARFDAASLRAFHRRWYRPDNMTLVVAGDVTAPTARALVQRVFGPVPAPGEPMPLRPALGAPDLADQHFALVQPERRDVMYHVQYTQLQPPRAETQASVRETVVLEAACEMARWTMAHLSRQRDAPVREVDVRGAYRWPWWGARVNGMAIRFDCTHEQREAALSTCGLAIRELFVQGFTPQLLDNVRALILEQHEALAVEEQASTSSDLANDLASSLADGRVSMTMQQRVALARSAWEALTATQCSSAFQALVRTPPSIVSIGPRPPAFDERATWSATQQAVVPASTSHSQAVRPAWPYDSSAVPESELPVPARTRDDRLDVEDVRFPNGVRLLVKKTSFAHDEVLVSVQLGSGAAGLRPELTAPAVVYVQAFTGLGLGRMAPSDLRRFALARASASWTTPDAFTLEVPTRTTALGFAFELLHAHCSDPGWDEEGMAAFAKSVTGMEQSAQHSFAEARGRFWAGLAGQRHRPTETELLAVTPQALQDWWTRALGRAPITVVAVGDLDVEATIAMVARTFGRLPLREPYATLPGQQLAGGVDRDLTIPTAKTRSEVSFVVALPTGRDPRAEPALGFLPLILGDRLRERLRELQGEVYAPSVELGRVEAGGAAHFLGGIVAVAPGHEQRVLDACRAELARLQAEGVSADELERARRPVLAQIEADRHGNRRWLSELGRAHSRPEALSECAGYLTTMRALTPGDLSRAAAWYLRADKVSTLILRPGQPR